MSTAKLPTLRGHVARAKAASRRYDWNRVLALVAFGVAALAVVNAGVRVPIGAGMTMGYALALMTIPLWLGTAGRYRYYLLIFSLTGVAIASGFALTAAHTGTNEVVWRQAVAASVLLGGTVLSAGVLLWVRPVLRQWHIAVLFGLGALVAALSASPSANPWKYHWSVPATVLALAAVQILRGRLVAIVALVPLIVISVANDSRSFAGILLVTSVIVIIQDLPLPDRMLRIGAGRALLIVMALGLISYTIISRLALSGVFGEKTQLRTEEQLLRAGSIILGARPELAAAVGLFVHSPMGWGSGTILDPSAIVVAQEAMARANYNGDNGYVYNYMFGETMELHSGLADFWALFGLPGFGLALVVLWAVLDALARLISMRSATALQVFLVLLTIWNMSSSPLLSLAPSLTLALGLLLLPTGEPRFLGLRRFEYDVEAPRRQVPK